jgi:uncharacterized membrane protein YeaQ/YmgE (transglycosylase-associated protein family)
MLFLSAAVTASEVVILIVIGLFVGLLGRLLHPGHDSIGLLTTTVIGVVSVLAVGLALHGPIGIFGYVIAVAVAALLVWLVTSHGRRRVRQRH